MRYWFNRLSAQDTLAIFVLTALPLIFFWRVALGLVVFNGDEVSSVFLPFRLMLAQALSEWRLPLWSPLLQAGYPIFAEGEIAALYPPNWILSLLPIQLALSYSVLLHLAWTCVGMYVFCRTSELQVTSALFAGFVFGFSGFFIAHNQHLALLASASWLPWLLFVQRQAQWAWHEGKRNWIIWVVLGGYIIALQIFAGSANIAAIDLFAFVIFGVIGGVISNRQTTLNLPRVVLGSFLLTLVSIVLGTGISAIQWLPTAELLNYSERGQELGSSFISSYSLTLPALAHFILPFDTLGRPTVTNLEYWGYIGIVPLLLAVISPALRRDVRTRFFFVFALVALSLALGDANPIYPLFNYIPVFNRFRVPARFIELVLFAIAFLAALSFEEVKHRLSDGSLARAVVLMAMFSALSGVLIVFGNALGLADWLRVWSILPWVLASMGVIGILCAAFRRIGAWNFSTLVVGLTLIDVICFAQPFAYTINPLIPAANLILPSRPVLAMENSPVPDRVFTTIYNESLRPNRLVVAGKPSAQIYSPLALQRNQAYTDAMSAAMLNLMNVRYFLQDSNAPLPPGPIGLDLLQAPVEIPPRRVTQVEITSFTDHTEKLTDGVLAGELTLTAVDGTQRVLPIRLGMDTADWAFDGFAQTSHSKPADVIRFPGYLLSLRQSFEGLKAVSRYTIRPPLRVTQISAKSNLPTGTLTIERVSLMDDSGKAASLAALAQRNDLSLVFKSHAVAMYENRNVLPRVFMVHRAEVLNDAQVWVRIHEPNFDPVQVVLLNDGAPREPNEQEIPSDQIVLVEYRPERVLINVSTDTPGYLLLADTWYPGWKVWVDGQLSTIHRADYLFRAVEIPAGRHHVLFEYFPASVVNGALISALAIIISSVSVGASMLVTRRHLH